MYAKKMSFLFISPLFLFIIQVSMSGCEDPDSRANKLYNHSIKDISKADSSDISSFAEKYHYYNSISTNLGEIVEKLSGTDLARRLLNGSEKIGKYSYKEIVEEAEKLNVYQKLEGNISLLLNTVMERRGEAFREKRAALSVLGGVEWFYSKGGVYEVPIKVAGLVPAAEFAILPSLSYSLCSSGNFAECLKCLKDSKDSAFDPRHSLPAILTAILYSEDAAIAADAKLIFKNFIENLQANPSILDYEYNLVFYGGRFDKERSVIMSRELRDLYDTVEEIVALDGDLEFGSCNHLLLIYRLAKIEIGFSEETVLNYLSKKIIRSELGSDFDIKKSIKGCERLPVNSSKGSEKDQWIKSKMFDFVQHQIECSRFIKENREQSSVKKDQTDKSDISITELMVFLKQKNVSKTISAVETALLRKNFEKSISYTDLALQSGILNANLLEGLVNSCLMLAVYKENGNGVLEVIDMKMKLSPEPNELTFLLGIFNQLEMKNQNRNAVDQSIEMHKIGFKIIDYYNIDLERLRRKQRG